MILQCKMNIQGRNLLPKNNRTVPIKNRTKGKFRRKKTIVHVRLFSTQE